MAASASIELTSSKNPSNVGDTVTFTAKVSSDAGWPTGEVEIFNGPDTTGTRSLVPQGVLIDANGEPQIAIGLNHSCAVTTAGAVRCWGDNEFGQLGDGTTDDHPDGVTVQSLESGAVAVAVGTKSSCALISTGAVKCWGDNELNQLGTGDTVDSLTPVTASGLGSGVVDIFSSEVDVCALQDDGDLYCWGFGNEGLMGNGTKDRVTTPARVPGLPAIRYLPPSMHDAYTLCVVTTTDAVWCWGRNNTGQVGNGTDGAQVLSPVEATITNVKTVAVGNAHNCALKKDGAVACWGWGDFGQIGEGSPATINSTPVTVTALAGDDIASVITGGIHSCAVLTDGTAKCWGSNVGFALGIEGQQSHIAQAPQAVTVVASGITALVGAEYGTVAAKSGGRLYALGTNANGRLGDGTTSDRSTPVVVKTMLSASTATLTLSDLPRGTTHMTALYVGTVDFDGVGGGSVNQLVVGANSSTSVSSGSGTFSFGDSVTLASSVNSSGTPTGTVTFKASGVVLGQATLDGNGLAVLTTAAIPAGTSNLTAEYGGDAATEPSTSSPKPITLAKAATTARLSSSTTKPLPGAGVTLTATLAAVTGSQKPTGSVTFSSGGKTLGTPTLVNGTATLSTALRTGERTITVAYAGTANFNAAANKSLTLSVSPKTGKETRVNSRTSGAQDTPAVVGLGGPYAVVWRSAGQDGSSFGVYGQRFAGSGAKAGGEVRVNSFTRLAQIRPAVAALKSGRWVAVWQSAGEDGSGAGIYARIYEASGKAGGAFRANVTTSGNQSAPTVTGLADGGFVIGWTADVSGSKTGIVLRAFRSTGTASGGEVKLPRSSTSRDDQPALATLANGDVAVVWRRVTGPALAKIMVQRFSPKLKSRASAARVDSNTSRAKSDPDVAALAGGGFIAAWVSDGQDGSGAGIYGQRYAASAKRAGPEIRISSVAKGEQTQPGLAGFTGGGYVATWTSGGQDGSGTGVYLRRYDASGNSNDATLRVNTVTSGAQDEPDVATLSKRAFVVTWTSEGQDTSGAGIYAQRFNLGLDASKPLP